MFYLFDVPWVTISLGEFTDTDLQYAYPGSEFLCGMAY